MSCFGVVYLPLSSVSWVVKLEIETAVGIGLKASEYSPLERYTIAYIG